MNLKTRALLLSYFTVGYNVVEGLVSIAAGVIAGSSALIGFGTDSFVESLSGSIMIWRFRKHGNMTHEEEERIEKKAIKLIAYAFFILCAYVIYESGKTLYLQEQPEKSLIGIIIAIASIIIMPVLFYLKYITGKSLKSKSLVADSKQTFACVMLSFALLLGLGLNYFFGIWWADPLAGLVIAGFLINEGYHAYREEEVCC